MLDPGIVGEPGEPGPERVERRMPGEDAGDGLDQALDVVAVDGQDQVLVGGADASFYPAR